MLCYSDEDLPCGPVAQLGARFHGMEEVESSNLSRSTKPPKIYLLFRQRSITQKLQRRRSLFCRQSPLMIVKDKHLGLQPIGFLNHFGYEVEEVEGPRAIATRDNRCQKEGPRCGRIEAGRSSRIATTGAVFCPRYNRHWKLYSAGAGPGLQNRRAAPLASQVGSTPSSFRHPSD